jgi:hypothetical protein
MLQQQLSRCGRWASPKFALIYDKAVSNTKAVYAKLFPLAVSHTLANFIRLNPRARTGYCMLVTQEEHSIAPLPG